ncbi:MAG: hypothetical protein QY323_02300 [Patescibacteria group bacterium]|nr:MAG: hypothetical protein QY323_02300 [Patescibacteria group bacterium]
MSKNNARSFGGNRKGPGYRTPSSFRGQASLKRIKGFPKNFKFK